MRSPGFTTRGNRSKLPGEKSASRSSVRRLLAVARHLVEESRRGTLDLGNRRPFRARLGHPFGRAGVEVE
jgi:hypothetical protein